MVASYGCPACGGSISVGAGGTVGPLKCWRDNCPGGKPRPNLRAVPRGEDTHPATGTAA